MISVTVAGDYHVLPAGKAVWKNDMRVLLSEALLEPYDYHLNETVPEGVVRVNSFIYRQGRRRFFMWTFPWN